MKLLKLLFETSVEEFICGYIICYHALFDSFMEKKM